MKVLTVKCVIRYLENNEKNHLYQIYYRVTKNRKSGYLPSGIMVMASDWDKKSGRCKEVYRNNAQKIVLHKNYNKQLEEHINDIKIGISEIPTSNTLTAQKVKQTILDKDRLGSKNVNEFFDEVIKNLEGKGQIGNRKAYIHAKNRFNKFAGKDITFNEITIELLKEYIKSLKKDGLDDNGIHQLIKKLRALYNRAIEDKIATKKQYLSAFENLKLNSLLVKTTHRALSIDEIDKLKKYKPLNNSEKLALAVFLFSYYNGGINVKDIAKLKKENIIGGVITFTRAKTSEPHIFPLHSESDAIIESQNNSSDYLFPILEACKDSDKKKVYNRIARITHQINKSLKVIGVNLKLSIKPLTTYVARHSYATHILFHGASLEQISQALNHKDVKTTKIYLGRFSNASIAKLGELL